MPSALPAHDAVLVAVSDSEANRPLLAAFQTVLSGWEKPVINLPTYIPNTERSRASTLLQEVPGLLMPATWELTREKLEAIACGNAGINDVIADCKFPIILRPVGSHGGHDLARIEDVQGIAEYLSEVNGSAFYLSRFIDYSNADGLFRKYRIALIAGRPFACHLAISSHWMIHYLNAGMYDDATKRTEEAYFMEHFDEFVRQHEIALTEIHRRSQLDYLCIDCAQTRDGQLLVFEIDHAMVVHAMDPEDLFPYKQVQMRKVQQAFEDFLWALGDPRRTTAPIEG
jgi:glutathione synthase/RimK-type ligase-like ATP-grasp enzyme